MANDTTRSIIALVRALINDRAGAEQQFYDEDIQRQLEALREWVVEELKPLPQPDGGQLRWRSANRYWEADLELTDPAGTALEPALSDPNSGYFTFADSQEAVYASGFVHDPYAAAAELLTLWAGRIEQDIIEFSSDGASYKFAGTIPQKLAMAAEYKAKSRTYGGIRTVRMVRNDIN